MQAYSYKLFSDIILLAGWRLVNGYKVEACSYLVCDN